MKCTHRMTWAFCLLCVSVPFNQLLVQEPDAEVDSLDALVWMERLAIG